MTARPRGVRLRAYNVGFGDCLLLTVTYGSKLPDGRRERHMLIDCGSHEYSDDGPDVVDIARKIAEHTGGLLDVVVATHRHDDHLSGFGHAQAGPLLDALNPRVVIRPWTDIPEARAADAGHRLDERDQGFISLLDGLQTQVEASDQLAFDSATLTRRANELAALGHKNGKAIAALEQWGAAGRAEYVRARDVVALDDEMPGVKVDVLGPPTLEQVPRLTSYAKSSESYWLQLAMSDELVGFVGCSRQDALEEARRVVADPDGVGAASWLVRALNRRRLTQGLDIVEGFDDVLNNTSVILLLTIGRRRVLLAGDAQAENWSLTLDEALGINGHRAKPKLRDQLAAVDVYKVGHHGSRNATPIPLFDLWKARDHARHPLVSVLTTKRGVFDKSIEGEVPNKDLVESLNDIGVVHRTDDLPANVWWFDVEAPTTGVSPFVFTSGPPMA